jgi:pimeloyl-ACP methyl ester carboxylesterase
MGPVAERISPITSVMEPIQTASSLDGQVAELAEIVEEKCECPVILIGWSWGAWLSFLLTARRPELVRKLILVGSGPFTEEYAHCIMPTRLRRLSREKRNEVSRIMDRLEVCSQGENDLLLARLGNIMSESDSYEPIGEAESIGCSYEIHSRVWKEASEMRRSGRLMEEGRSVKCPVVAIHGDFDPHPHEGVIEPLSEILDDFNFHLLKRCGHTPWMERYAREEFFGLIASELQ